MSFIVTKTSTIPCLQELCDEINQDPIIVGTGSPLTLCEFIRLDAPSTMIITFAGTGPLSGAQDTALDTLLATFECSPTPEDVETSFVTLTDANGVESEPQFMIEDTTRANRILTVDTTTVVYTKSQVDNLDWVSPINPNSDSAYLAPYDGTVVRCQINVVDVNNVDIDYTFFANKTNVGLLVNVSPISVGSPPGSPILFEGSPSGTGTVKEQNNNLSLDFSRGDALSIRALENGIESTTQLDVVITLQVKWRKL